MHRPFPILALLGLIVGYHRAHYMLALAREANGDVGGAVASLRRALAIHPAYPNAMEKLATLQP